MSSSVLRSAAVALAFFMVDACAESVPGTELAGAARRGDLNEIDRLLAAGADVDEPSNLSDWPPIIHAIHQGQRAALERLLERGASVHGAIGRKALFLASGYADVEMVRTLLSHGAAMPEDAESLASLVAATIHGYRPATCDEQAQVMRLLVARDPDLRVVFPLSPGSFARFRATLENRIARWKARRRGCDELLRIVSHP